MAVADALTADEITGDGHETQPPARYTEASLVKRLAELEIGRPSTYASIMQTIQDREYVWKKGSALIPSLTAFSVVGLLEQHFPDLVDYSYTKRMEDELDSIAGGESEAIPWLQAVLLRRRARRSASRRRSTNDSARSTLGRSTRFRWV